VKGVCQRGGDCRYSHDLGLIASTARGGSSCTRPGEVCYDFLRWALKHLHGMRLSAGLMMIPRNVLKRVLLPKNPISIPSSCLLLHLSGGVA